MDKNNNDKKIPIKEYETVKFFVQFVLKHSQTLMTSNEAFIAIAKGRMD